MEGEGDASSGSFDEDISIDSPPPQPPTQREASVNTEPSPPLTPTAYTPPETPTQRTWPKPAPAIPGGVVPVRRKPPPKGGDELKRPDVKGNDYSGKSSHQIKETDELKEVDTVAKLHFRGMTADFPSIFQQATLGVKHVNALKEAVSRLSKMEQEHAKKLEKLFSDDTKKISKLMEGDGIVLFSGVWNELMMVVNDKFECTKQAAEQVNEEIVKPCTELEKESNAALKAVAAMVKQQERDLKKCTDVLTESKQEATKTLELMRSYNEKEKTETNIKKKAEWTTKHATARAQAAEQAFVAEQRVVEVNKQSHVFENEIRNALDQLEDLEQKRVRQLQTSLSGYLRIACEMSDTQCELADSALEIMKEMNPEKSMQTFKFDWLVDFGDPPPIAEFTYDLPLTFDEITAGATLTKGLQMFVIEDSDSLSSIAATINTSHSLPVDSKAPPPPPSSSASSTSSPISLLTRSQSTLSMLKKQETKADGVSLPPTETHVIYVAGGFDGVNTLNTIEKYENGRWETLSLPTTPSTSATTASTATNTLSSKRVDLALCGSADGKCLYVVGGSDENNAVLPTVERYDAQTNKWTKLTDMLAKRQCASVVIVDNKLFVIGGHDGVAPVCTVEMYDSIHNKWKKMNDMFYKRQSGGVAVLEGRIFALGGNDGKERLSSLECYEPDKNKWRKLADMSSKRYGVGVAALDGKLYVAGGNDGTKRLSSAERYDPKTNKWEKLADMNTVRAALGLVVMGSQLYAVGGFDGTNRLASAERYDVVTNRWELLPGLLGTARSAHGIAAL